MPHIPTEEEILGYFETFSNWGRWGSEDQLGTLNFITEEKRREAGTLIKQGRSVSCCWDIDAPGMQRYMLETGQGLRDPERLPNAGWAKYERAGTATDMISFQTHGYLVTHLDAFSHIFWDEKMYNNRPTEWVSSVHGASKNAITNAHEGIFPRGVLIDIPKHRGIPWLEAGDPVHHDEVEEILANAGIEVREGDAMLLRTGHGRRRLEKGIDETPGRAGWHASCLPFFYDHGVALIGADTAQEVVPTGYQQCRRPINAVGSVAMGLCSMDNCNFEPLAAICAELNVYEFALSIAPIPFVGATGSPVNPLALF